MLGIEKNNAREEMEGTPEEQNIPNQGKTHRTAEEKLCSVALFLGSAVNTHTHTHFERVDHRILSSSLFVFLVIVCMLVDVIWIHTEE